MLDFPKISRYSFGFKIDSLFVDTAGLLYSAAHLPKSEKLPVLSKASDNLDLLKFFLQLSWEMRLLDNKKYIALAEKLNEIGNMLGGWRKQIISQTPFK